MACAPRFLAHHDRRERGFAAGAPHRFTSNGIQQAIREAGFELQLRNQQFEDRQLPETIEQQLITY